MPETATKLRFHKRNNSMGGADEWGEITLHHDDTVRLSASEGLRRRLLGTAKRVDDAALMYGAGAFMGIAALGTTFIVKKKSVWGYLLLALAALVALGGSRIRTAAQSAPRIFDSPLDKDSVSAEISSDGNVTIIIAAKLWKATTLRLHPGEYDPREAEILIATLRTR